MKIILIALLLATAACANAQRVGIGTNTPHSSARLDITATNGGILIPRLTTAQRNAINPVAPGLLVYDSDTQGFWFYNGTSWNNLSATANTWNTGGNAGTDSTANYIGTTDGMPLVFRVRNLRSGKIDSASAGTSFGYRAMSGIVTGGSNSAFGFKSLLNNTSGRNNTAIGANAMMTNTTGNSNIAIGFETLYSSTNGTQNVAIGPGSLYSNTLGFSNIAIGLDALRSNTEGLFNTAIGVQAMYNNTTGEYNTAIGNSSMVLNTTGGFNTAVGQESMTNNRTGIGNTAMGVAALLHNETGSDNTAIGKEALYWSTGLNNTAVGQKALYRNSGHSNTALGKEALGLKLEGGGNTALGFRALSDLIGGSDNVAIGPYAGTTAGPWNNTISIGNIGVPNAFHSQAFIGNFSTAWIGGCVGWSVFSDARLKTNVKEEVKGLDFITRLRPVVYSKSIKEMALVTGNKETPDFEGKYEVESTRYSGFIAQEVEAAAKLSGYDFSGVKKINGPDGFYTLSYESFVVPLVKAVQEQQKEIEELKKQLEKIRNPSTLHPSTPLKTQ